MKRLAMLIGNNNYISGPKLSSAINDVRELNDKLVSLDFETMVFYDVGYLAMGEHIAEFDKKAEKYDVGLFYFAGHGFQFDEENYLALVDSSLTDRKSAAYTSVKLSEIIDMLERCKLSLKIVINDACRENPFVGERGGYNGMGTMFAPQGTIIAFATSPGQTAIERGNHGIYTEALLSHISTPNLPIEAMFKRVRNTVYTLSDKRQIPWEHTSLLGEFKFLEEKPEVSMSMKYENYALADELYESCESEVDGLISDLQSHNYNIQNPVIAKLLLLNNILQSVNKNALLILGRNLYQASSDAFDVSRYFEKLHYNLSNIPYEARKHILTGMTYEIYFDSKAKLRRRFKLHHCKEVIKEVLLPEYNEVRIFLANSLIGFDQRIMYIPGDKTDYYFKIILNENHDKVYELESILYEGQNILYSWNDDKYCSDCYEDELSITILKNRISEVTLIPLSFFKIETFINNDISHEINLTEAQVIKFSRFSLLRYVSD